ncbi:unnamed protein product [Acanthoscelides obtectus]|uniref:Matrix metalloproteinase n=1 Tax=Acanthoscelides obtectus TaxID=200917 RepID=A0A9P0JZA5_ACAOB|nr:unnamed protein product [Acanthoscelides obtectus]CAK1663990.1 Matrix metalloproteinase-2 [Acanthoscelides obtectus]
MYPWYKEMDNGFDFELPEDDKQAIQHLYGARDDRRQWGRIPEYYPSMTTPSTTTSTSTTTRPSTTSRPRIYYTRRPVPYDPRYPQGKRPYSPTQKTYYPQKPMHPDKKPHYPRPGGTYPYGPDKNHPHHKHTTDTTPVGSEPRHPHHHTPDRRHPDHHQPEKSPDTHHPERVPPTRPRPSNPDKSLPGKNHPHHGPPKESPLPAPDTCDTSYDAVAVIRREVFIFKDAYFWRIDESGLMPGYPAEIKRFWHGLPMNLTHVDAVYERPDGRIVFFIDDNYYVFYNNRVEHGYPRKLTNLGLPSDLKKIDGAMVWGHNGKTYFYSGNKYWKFDEEIQKVELDYPRKITDSWKGVGRDIDAVFQWKDGKTYFFKGKGFWKFNDLFMRVEHDEPRPSAPFWMGCTPNIEEGQKLPYKEAASKASCDTFSLFLILISICHTVFRIVL